MKMFIRFQENLIYFLSFHLKLKLKKHLKNVIKKKKNTIPIVFTFPENFESYLSLTTISHILVKHYSL